MDANMDSNSTSNSMTLPSELNTNSNAFSESLSMSLDPDGLNIYSFSSGAQDYGVYNSLGYPNFPTTGRQPYAQLPRPSPVSITDDQHKEVQRSPIRPMRQRQPQVGENPAQQARERHQPSGNRTRAAPSAQGQTHLSSNVVPAEGCPCQQWEWMRPEYWLLVKCPCCGLLQLGRQAYVWENPPFGPIIERDDPRAEQWIAQWMAQERQRMNEYQQASPSQ